jgi:hypothetical protein
MRLERALRLVPAFVVVGGLVALPSVARAATYEVGPGKPFREITEVTARLKAGDVVEIQGNASYKAFEIESQGTETAPITFRGVRVAGKRPLVAGGEITILVLGNHVVLEGLEVSGGTQDCVVHRAHGTVLRDDVVHGCPRHGILGTDTDSGSITMEYVEVYDAGADRPSESLKHPVYIATDERAHPGSVFRMQHCYVHDANGGNSVKSRAERNEIYGNWLEGGQYYELELIGPDDGDTLTAPREDSDVVGNVFFQTKSVSYVVRIGGDGSGRTGGRYRFVNNTFVHAANEGNFGAFRFSYSLESVELYNNVFVSPRPIEYLARETELQWVSGRRVAGANNWITTGTTNIPEGLTGTIFGTDPGFVDLAKRDVRPKAESPLVDKGAATTARTDAYAIPRPLAKPTHTPPLRGLPALGKATVRASVGAIDIGAYEYGSATEEPGVPGTEPPIPSGTPGADGGLSGDGGPTTSADPSDSGCTCEAAGATANGRAPLVGGLAFVGLAVSAAARRRGSSRARRVSEK